MGAVYLARDISLEREVALKVLAPSLTRDAQMVERFVREARSQARISHPNITQIYFIGEEHGYHFFAMEFVRGKTLAQVLDGEGALPWERALGYARQAAMGLAAAHRSDVIHQDVKPSNLILTQDNLIKIADFGLARRVARDPRITGTGEITGTPAYMSPEQAKGEESDFRSDIYSLGASLFHLIAGRPPFQGDSAMATVAQHLTAKPPRLSDVDPSTPRRVCELVARCLEKEPDRRFRSYEELLRAMDEAMPRKLTPGGIYARFSAVVFDFAVIALAASLLPGNLARVVFYASYFLLFESLLGWTPGKKVLKLVVRKADGRRALPARIGLRFILAHWVFFAAAGVLQALSGIRPEDWRRLGLEFLREHQEVSILLAVLVLLYALGLAAIGASRRKRALHDSLTGTAVVYELH
jgi:uncharacterized RDD family membrane protein YckC